MTNKNSQCLVLGLFQQRIEGDDALLRLAGLRFKQAGLGAEFYAESSSELERLLRFKPLPETPAAVHLSRSLNVFERAGRETVNEFARRFKGQIFGMIIHDQGEIGALFNEYSALLRELESDLDKVEETPYLFIEYAAGLEPDRPPLLHGGGPSGGGQAASR